MVISPVLKFVALTSTNVEILPVAIRAMTALWMKQVKSNFLFFIQKICGHHFLVHFCVENLFYSYR